MFDIGKGGAGVNVPAKVDPWNTGGMNLRQVDKGLQFDPKGMQNLAATPPQQQAQFSPAQFGGAGGGQSLSQLIAALLKGTGGQ